MEVPAGPKAHAVRRLHGEVTPAHRFKQQDRYAGFQHSAFDIDNELVVLHHAQGSVSAGDEVDVLLFEGLI